MQLQMSNGEMINRKRQDFMNALRKQHRNELFSRRRAELQLQSTNTIEIYQYYDRLINESQQFNYELVQQLIELTKTNNPNFYIMLGNYMLEHLIKSTDYLFPLMKSYSSSPYYSWIVRLLLESTGGHDKEEYLQHIDRFIAEENKQIIFHGLQCVEYLIQHQMIASVLKLQNLELVVKKHFHAPANKIKSVSATIFVSMIEFAPSARERFSNWKIEQEILILLKDNQKRRNCGIQIIKNLVSSFVLEPISEEVVKELLFLEVTESIEAKTQISELWLDICKSASSQKIVDMLNLGLKDNLCKNIVYVEYSQFITLKSLKTLEEIYDRFEMEGLSNTNNKLKVYFEQHYCLSRILDTLCNNQNKNISQLASLILDGHYTYQVDDDLNVVEWKYS